MIRRANDMLQRARGLVVEAKRLAYQVGDAGACGAIDAAFAALTECRVVAAGEERLGQPPMQPAARNPRPDPTTRYQTDPVFHVLVDTLRSFLAQHQFTPSELREAAMLAAAIHEAETIRPLIIGRPWEG